MKDLFTFEVEPFPILGRDRMQPEIIGADTRVCVTDTKAAPFRYICSLETDSLGAMCSGTLIGPRTVLTAGHCPEGETASKMQVFSARNGLTHSAVSRCADFVFAPKYSSATPTDYAVLILKDPIGNKNGWWTYDPFRWPGDTVGTSILKGSLPKKAAELSVNISGYPADRPKSGEACFSSTNDLRGKRQYRAFDSAVRVTPAGILEYVNDTFGGMSGSPVWIKRDLSLGGRVMLAVHISGDDGAFAGKANRGVFIQGSVLEFIKAHSFFPPTAPPSGAGGRATVRSGSKGSTVQELQYRLNIWIAITPAAGIARLVVDGDFGPKTNAAARAFQKAMKLAVDGIVGPQTWNRLLLPF
ncbi:MAG: trypsin-like serine protease [Verrucomicrobia bacterium]|nr:trypsin-like serine protease [Verrucomicrobiota bacterium]